MLSFIILGSRIPQGEFASWNNQPFVIPACPPTIDKSRVIQVRYQVQVKVDVPWGFDPTLKFPITMGTVPYQAAYGQQQPPLMNQVVPSKYEIIDNFGLYIFNFYSYILFLKMFSRFFDDFIMLLKSLEKSFLYHSSTVL